MTEPALHPARQGWQTIGGELLVGGVPLSRLAQRVGQTPFFAYDRARVAARVGALRAHLPSGLDLHYAIKANPMPALVAFLAPLVDGFDVASAGELAKALDAGLAPDRKLVQVSSLRRARRRPPRSEPENALRRLAKVAVGACSPMAGVNGRGLRRGSRCGG